MSEAPSKRRQWIVFVVVGTLSLIADQITKIWARGALPTFGHGSGVAGACKIPDDIIVHMCQGKSVPIIDGYWDWRLSMNPGSAFGLFSSLTVGRILLSIVGIAAVIGMIFMLRKARPDQKVLHWALALVAGGAIGNLVDRIRYGYVIDFIDVYVKGGGHERHWPTFNVADIAIVVGVLLMGLDMLFSRRTAPPPLSRAMT